MIVSGTVQLLSCPECGADHPLFRFCGDTDMATDGLASAGDRDRQRLALFHTRDAEVEQDEELRSARLAEAIQRAPSAVGLDFQSFRTLYQPSELTYRCPWCDAAETTVSQEMTPAEFVDAGGRIDCIGAIELREGQAFS
ncbi:hypothetical protein OIK40_12765 [Erythrobacter sp. sf7]|uniref:Uncharacterized protein n=1 Tax=Erythrobacter fulvus TaxID=2987523 RepID=A0ABT5JS37_9SPHN|nr:hypothetical protein [Erythrobacter fulvus]MDC8755514.1 hypothetical protein [Erythrobacter fulvus]